MQITKAFFLIVKRQNRTLFIYLFVFIVLLLFFAQGRQEQREKLFQSSSLDIIIQDRDQSVLSKDLCQYLSKKHHVTQNNYTEEEISDELYYESIDYVLTIPAGFEDNMTAGKMEDIVENRKQPGSASGYFADAQINQYLKVLDTFLTAGCTPKEAAAATRKAVARESDVDFLLSEQSGINQILYNAFCYMPYVLICLLTVGLGIILITFQQEEIHARIQCSSLSAFRRNLQLTLGSIVFSLVCWVSLLLASIIFLQVRPFSTQWLLCLLNSFVFLLFAMSVTLFISFLVHSGAVLNMLANIVGLGLSFLGGVYVPMEIMSSAVVTFARFLPSYWYITALEHINDFSGKTSQLREIFSCIGVEFLFALAIFCAALTTSRLKKQA